MKIIYVHTGKFPSNSPSMTFVLYNAQSLANNSESTYLFLKKNSNEKTDKILSEKFGISDCPNLIVKTVSVPFGLKSNALFFLKLYFQINKILNKEKIDAIITRSTKFLPWLTAIKKSGIKAYYETHDFYADLKIRDGIITADKIRRERIEKKYIPKLDGVFCLQNSQMSLYKKSIRDFNKYYLLRTGINKIYQADFNERKYISYIGSFDPHKGVSELLKSYSELTCIYQLLLIGGKNADEISSMRELITSMHLENKVRVTGWLTKSEIVDLLKKTLIGVVPLRDDFFNQYLTSPLKLFDYFSCGIPVVASDLPSIRELLEENNTGYFFEAGNTDDMKEKITYAISNLGQLKNMSDNVYDYANKLLWSERAQNIISVIKESNL